MDLLHIALIVLALGGAWALAELALAFAAAARSSIRLTPRSPSSTALLRRPVPS
mgnify:CR=1 FL=1